MGKEINYQYLIEKNTIMPLCAYDGENYIDYFTGEIITDKKVLNFIKNGLSNNSIGIKKLNLLISRILYKGYPVGYKYSIDDSLNFLDMNKKVLLISKLCFYLDKLKTGECVEEVVWSDVS